MQDTNVLKGFALILLLVHHLFYIQNELYDDMTILNYNHGPIFYLAQVCKVCVALFVFLSGYGLTKKYGGETIDIRRFYVERFAKLMPAFWFIWLLFVPIGMLFFDRTFESVYGNHIILKCIIQLLGLQDYAGFYGFNATWWFMSCIIGLYLLYPYLLKFIQKGYELWLLGGSFILMFFHIPHSACLTLYLFPFVLGIHCAKGIVVPPPRIQRTSLLACAIILTSLWRQFGIGPVGVYIDPLLVLEIILLFKSLNVKCPWIVATLSVIGRHSMNIFLFHTFIYYHYFEDSIYYTRNPLLIFITLLVVCLTISMGIEYLKKELHFAQCQQIIINKLT